MEVAGWTVAPGREDDLDADKGEAVHLEAELERSLEAALTRHVRALLREYAGRRGLDRGRVVELVRRVVERAVSD